jgi:hypothetical protein
VSEGPSRVGRSTPPVAAEGDAPPPPGDPPPSRRPPRRRWRGPLLLLLAMIVAFVMGVGVATRTELFPPQVAGAAPGASATTPGPMPGSLRERWRGTMTTTTSQQYSAGFCTTDWRSGIELVVHRGTVRGQGRARLVGRPRCPFPTTQPQITGYAFSVTGSVRRSASGSVSGAGSADGFRLSLGAFEPTRGIYDYGGFALTLADRRTTVDARLRGRHRAEGRTSSQTRTALGKLVRSRSLVRLACTSCGGA